MWHLLWGLTNWGISSLSSEYCNVRVSEETLNCLFPSRLLLYCALECILKIIHMFLFTKMGVNFSTAPFTKVSLGERMPKLTDVISASLHCLLKFFYSYFWWIRRKTRPALLNCFLYSNKSCNMIWGCASLSFTPQTTFRFLERPSRATSRTHISMGMKAKRSTASLQNISWQFTNYLATISNCLKLDSHMSWNF